MGWWETRPASALSPLGSLGWRGGARRPGDLSLHSDLTGLDSYDFQPHLRVDKGKVELGSRPKPHLSHFVFYLIKKLNMTLCLTSSRIFFYYIILDFLLLHPLFWVNLKNSFFPTVTAKFLPWPPSSSEEMAKRGISMIAEQQRLRTVRGGLESLSVWDDSETDRRFRSLERER